MENDVKAPLNDKDLLGYADAWLKDLHDIPAGSYKVKNSLFSFGKRKGWLAVDHDAGGCTNIMWTTGRDTHQSLDGGCAFSITVDPKGRLQSYFESAIRMHMVWGYGRGKQNELLRGLEAAWWMHHKLIHHQAPPTPQRTTIAHWICRVFFRQATARPMAQRHP